MCNNSSCGCNFNRCRNLGPFVAVDVNCIIPPAPGPGPGTTPLNITFSSGLQPTTLVTTAGGAVASVSRIGFGTVGIGLTFTGADLVLPGLLPADYYTVQQASNLTAISAIHNTIAGLVVGAGTGTIAAQVYRAPQGSDTFSPIGPVVTLSPNITLPLVVTTQSTGSDSSFTPVPLAVGDRLIVVFSLTATGVTAAATAIGNAQATITIE